MLNFQNQSAFITGGSSGIGKSLAQEFILAGGMVTICSRDAVKLSKAKEELVSNTKCDPNSIHLLPLDITDLKDVQQQIQEFLTHHDAPDYLINCAGAAHPGEFLDLGMDIFRGLMEVNYFGSVNLIKAFLPAMLERGSGHITNICSSAGFLGVYGYTAYGASKYAIRGFSDALRSELKLKNIHMSLVFPPDTDTPQLAYEAAFKPPITQALADTAGVLSPNVVARSILSGIQKNKYIIVPGFENALLYHLSNILGPNVYWVMDQMIAAAVRKIKTKK